MDNVSIERADKADLQKILELQYLAYQSEAQLFGDKNIPPLMQTLSDIEAESADSARNFLPRLKRIVQPNVTNCSQARGACAISGCTNAWVTKNFASGR